MAVQDGVPAIAPRSELVRWAAMAGIAGPILFTLGFVVQERLRSGEYDPVRDVVSALAVGGRGWMQQVNFVTLGVLTMIFAVGLHRGLPYTRAGIVGPVALFISGTANVLAAIFPLREDVTGAAYDPGGHQIAGVLFFASSAVALIALSRRCATDSRSRTISRWILAAGILAALSFPLMGALVIPEDAPLHEWAGLAQRLILLLLLFPARIALATHLLRVATGH